MNNVTLECSLVGLSVHFLNSAVHHVNTIMLFRKAFSFSDDYNLSVHYNHKTSKHHKTSNDILNNIDPIIITINLVLQDQYYLYWL